MSAIALDYDELEKTGNAAADEEQIARRAPLLDRNGRLLASTMQTWEVYVHPRESLGAGGVSADDLEKLGDVFPQLNLIEMRRHLNEGKRKFAWIARKASPDQWRRARDLGIIGVYAKPREDRVYPAGRVVSHIVGGVDVDNIGVAGVEAALNERISRPDRRDTPVHLSVDLRVQTALHRTLLAAKSEFAAPGAAGLVMDVRTGELIAMVSLPDFDPNDRPPAPATIEQQARSPIFNKVTQGAFELGSIFKLLTAATALESGAATLETPLDATRPIRRGGFPIDDFLGKYRWMSLREMVQHSSNIAAVRVTELIGPERQQAYLENFGLGERVPAIGVPQGELSKGQLPVKWGPAESATVSYGHGISVSPLHYVTALASVVNYGCRVTPTLLKVDKAATDKECDRVVSSATSEKIRGLMRLVAETTSGRNANIPGYDIGGKTGTAYQVNPNGGYNTDKRLNSFVALWPTTKPQYLMLISLDDPKLLDETRRNPLAGLTAAPTAGRALERIAPLLGMIPNDRFNETADFFEWPGDRG
ncbi:penicillin-binding protein 2 [uncultured Tateyamaria sp.]|uniref:peptidoglycan D,D-transpeptidase FtsI family protein n=1 Tax=uncultured Tateyamaria sp. TaxID=455651 RepID=UPI00260AEEC7|nr:penicillin-binding protein 2 [uncultured Tateyamaria sp.]